VRDDAGTRVIAAIYLWVPISPEARESAGNSPVALRAARRITQENKRNASVQAALSSGVHSDPKACSSVHSKAAPALG
jgi:hypothetical protein